VCHFFKAIFAGFVMGHEDLSTTMTYLHPDVSEVKQVIDRRNEHKGDWATASVTAALQSIGL
jgi:hypothetical protein